jgi:hypothetical protein
MVPPRSRMAPADDPDGVARSSPLWARYGEREDSQSARELLAGRLEAASEAATSPLPPMEHVPVPKPMRRRRAPAPAKPADLGDFLSSRQGRRIQKEVVRGVFGMLRKRL